MRLSAVELTDYCNKPVGDYIAPSPNVVAMAKVGPTTFAWLHWIGHPRKPPGRCKHLGSICHTSRLIGDFFANFGESILGVRGPKSKIEEQCFVEGLVENWRQKWLDSIEKQKRRINLKYVTKRQTDGQTESTTNNNRLLARHGDQQ